MRRAVPGPLLQAAVLAYHQAWNLFDPVLNADPLHGVTGAAGRAGQHGPRIPCCTRVACDAVAKARVRRLLVPAIAGPPPNEPGAPHPWSPPARARRRWAPS